MLESRAMNMSSLEARMPTWLIEAALVVVQFFPYLATGLMVISATLAVVHAVMTKHDERSAVGWVGVVALVPALGPLLYLLFGINRIRRRAGASYPTPSLAPQASPHAHQATTNDPLAPLRHLSGRVTQRPLSTGNRVAPLHSGDEAYPAMLEAIAQAQRSVALCTYIFDNDPIGKMFCEALGAAVRRGVTVRVLVDAVGGRYSWPPVTKQLSKHGVPWALYGKTRWPWRMPYANLRNHRKILVVDGRIAFTGGINIREGHALARQPKHPVADLHFCIDGPVIAHLWETFAQDWSFTTDERLDAPAWALAPVPGSGTVQARGVREGPDEDFEKLHLVLFGALACARRSVTVVTPYFLPDQLLITALNTAAMRGVDVQVVMPQQSNLRLVDWASGAVLPQLMYAGVVVHATHGIFDHSKLMLVDDQWALIGSANWDARSLRLNFEFNIECYSEALVAELRTWVDQKVKNSSRVTLSDLRKQSFLRRLRDNVVHLASPYL